jgi:hypothetical protein
LFCRLVVADQNGRDCSKGTKKIQTLDSYNFKGPNFCERAVAELYRAEDGGALSVARVWADCLRTFSRRARLCWHVQLPRLR